MLPFLPVLMMLVVSTEGSGVNCSDGVFAQCSSCTSFVLCTTGTTFSCPTTAPLCEESNDGTVATCSSSASDCACPPLQELPAIIVDYYDESKYIICLPGMDPIYQSCPLGTIFNTDSEKCEEPEPTTPPTTTTTTTMPPATCNKQGFHPVLDSCEGYYYCYFGGNGDLVATDAIMCNTDAGEVYNPYQPGCASNPTPPPTPTKCPDGSQTVGDPVECNAFYVCLNVGGDVFGEAVCCGPNQVYDPSASWPCVEDTNTASCPSKDPCLPEGYGKKCPISMPPTTTTHLPSNSSSPPSPKSKDTTLSNPDPAINTTLPINTTTTTTTTTFVPTQPTCSSTNLGTFYEYHGDCNKYYYCKLGNLYTFSCSASLIFNANINLCDLPSNYQCPY